MFEPDVQGVGEELQFAVHPQGQVLSLLAGAGREVHDRPAFLERVHVERPHLLKEQRLREICPASVLGDY